MATLRDAFLGGTFRQQPAMGSVRAGIDESIGRERQRAALASQEQAVEFAPAREERAIAGEERAQKAAQNSLAVQTAEELRKSKKEDRIDALNVAKVVGSIENPEDIDLARQLHPKDLADLTPDNLQEFQDRSKLVVAGSEVLSASQREFADLTKVLEDPDDQLKAVRVKLGLDPRAVAAAPRFVADLGAVVDPTTATGERVTVGGEVQTPEIIAQRQAEAAQEKKFGADVGAARAKVIKDSFDTIRNTETSIRSLEKVKKNIQEGARTGVVANWFPTFRKQTIALQAAVNEAGLDIVSATTFGALSKGELDLSLDTAVPTGLEGPDLIVWVDERVDAKRKLMAYLDGQISFIEAGGSLAEWRQSQRELQTSPEQTQQVTQQQFQEGQTATGPNGEKMIFRGGQWQTP